MSDNSVFRLVYRTNPDEIYFTFEMLDNSVLLRLVVNSVGVVQFLRWKNRYRAWVPMVNLNLNICDWYGACGPYGICNPDGPGCDCLNGFIAISYRDWNRLDFSEGCKRKVGLNCSDDGFVKFRGLKLPDNFTIRHDLKPEECRDYCFNECACMAYTNIDVYGNGNKCVTWSDKLVDFRDSTHGGDELYIRMASAEIESIHHAKTKKHVVMICILVLATLWLTVICCTMNDCISACKKSKNQDGQENMELVHVGDDEQDIRLFKKCIVSSATNNFSLANKIGEGGFGPVYQGELTDGRKIAVKRLSEHSNQGIREFKNEVNLIAQLQHRNLVKLLGCCTEGGERMLIYEYMQNKSLDQLLFEPARNRLLRWDTRFSILKGTAKGLDYLHSGSRLKIIHRDLKASNILLDDEMNPKISDFGVARNSENEREETTRRVVGTHGYMSPEYMMDGQYSTKSDVFSFGVLALEMLSGRKNWGFHHPDHEFNLLGHAWKLWIEGREFEFIDPTLEEPYEENEIRRCIQIGLLCVQHMTEGRPTMSQVVSMLESEHVIPLQPEEPGFYRRTSTIGWNPESINGLTITTLTARS